MRDKILEKTSYIKDKTEQLEKMKAEWANEQSVSDKLRKEIEVLEKQKSLLEEDIDTYKR